MLFTPPLLVSIYSGSFAAPSPLAVFQRLVLGLSLYSPSRDEHFNFHNFGHLRSVRQGLSNLHLALNSLWPSDLYIQLPTWHIYWTILLTCPKLNSWSCSPLPTQVNKYNKKNERQELCSFLWFLHYSGEKTKQKQKNLKQNHFYFVLKLKLWETWFTNHFPSLLSLIWQYNHQIKLIYA